MITLFGATGYTGRLVAAALDAAGLSYRLAGRSPARLAALAASLPARPAWLVADALCRDTLEPLCRDCRVLINCAGPFTDLGERVLAPAALHGVHYIDTTNELGYAHQVQGYDHLAARTGAVVVPACGFEVALSDCAAAVLAADAAAPPDDLAVVYRLHGSGSSLGTRRSAVRALATSWLGYRDGGWVPAVPGLPARRLQLPGGPCPALSIPSSEIVTVPHHLAVRSVTVWLAVSRPALTWGPVLVPAFARLARGPAGRLVQALIGTISAPPHAGLRSETPFVVHVEARWGGETRWLSLAGRGVYDLTARIVAYAAARLIDAPPGRAGVLPPAAALDPRALLDHAAARWGVAVQRGESA